LKLPRRTLTFFLLAAIVASAYVVSAQDAPKMQLPADRRAYTAARAKLDPSERLAAMRQFLVDYPKSDRASRAQTAILDLLLANFPNRISEIDTQAKLMIEQAGKGDSRRNQEIVVAQKLAEAGPNGIDLPLAETFATDAAKSEPEAAYAQKQTAMYVKAKVPPPSAKEIHASYIQDKSEFLSVVAEVLMHEGKLDQARKIAEEAFATDPTVDDTNSIRGEIALKDHDNAKALDSFERAQIYGALRPMDRDQMLTLYRDSHNGSDAGLAKDQDARYEQLFPAPFEPAAHHATASGHTVLLELFTGSGCQPCVGADLAMEGVLAAYPRSEVVALAFDQHIPLPDPLANADSIAHGTEYGINHTPTFSIDGQTLEPNGGSRTDAEQLYKTVTKPLDADITRPTAVQLQLTAAIADGSKVEARAHFTLPSDDILQKELATLPVPPPPAKPDSKPNAKPAPAVVPTAPATPALTLNFALVEDEVRYSGENGMRFHRMVVRALAKPSELATANATSLDASFDLATISQKNTEYLAAFEKHNERFENTHFLSNDTAINPAHLKVVAWIENPADHRVLQTAFVSLSSGTKMEAGQ
jgi:hypothetical protein